MSRPASSWIGQTLDDRYRIEELLGEGGMGAVFRAEHLRLAKKVALKIILPEHAGNAELAARFARESMVTASLEHPHIVSALDSGSLPDGAAYLVMTLAAGSSLRTLLRRGPLPVPLACTLGAQIADALVLAHARGVVHRDLKPENVMVEELPAGGVRVRVLDFGIARTAEAEASGLTRVGAVLGTPGYMAPEQALGDAVDARADLYALGVMLWEMVAGRVLFPQADLREIALAQLTEPVPLLPGAPAELQTLVEQLLVPRRDDRLASAREVLSRLQALAGGGVGTSSPGVIPVSPAAAGPSASASLAAAGELATAATVHAEAAPSLTGVPAASAARALLASPPARRALGVGAVLLGLFSCGGLFTRTCGPAAEVSVAAPPPGPLDVALAAVTGGDLDVPADLRADVDTLVAGTDDAARREAAGRVAVARGRVPPFAGHLADFELAEDCDDRRDAVRALREDGDPRAIPALVRMQDLPRRGCGPFGVADCHRCMRRDVERTLTELVEAEHGEPDEGDDAADEPRSRRRGRRGR